MISARRNSREAVGMLLAHQALVDAKDKEQKSALMWAAGAGNTKVAELLLAQGADPHAKDSKGRTALLLGADTFNPQVPLIQLLLANGADVNATDNQGNTALMLAAGPGAFTVLTGSRCPIMALKGPSKFILGRQAAGRCTTPIDPQYTNPIVSQYLPLRFARAKLRNEKDTI